MNEFQEQTKLVRVLRQLMFLKQSTQNETLGSRFVESADSANNSCYASQVESRTDSKSAVGVEKYAFSDYECNS